MLVFIGVNRAFFAVLNKFPEEKNIVNMERANCAYSTTPYLLGKFFVDIPACIPPAFDYDSILYFLVDLNSDSSPSSWGLL